MKLPHSCLQVICFGHTVWVPQFSLSSFQQRNVLKSPEKNAQAGTCSVQLCHCVKQGIEQTFPCWKSEVSTWYWRKPQGDGFFAFKWEWLILPVDPGKQQWPRLSTKGQSNCLCHFAFFRFHTTIARMTTTDHRETMRVCSGEPEMKGRACISPPTTAMAASQGWKGVAPLASRAKPATSATDLDCVFVGIVFVQQTAAIPLRWYFSKASKSMMMDKHHYQKVNAQFPCTFNENLEFMLHWQRITMICCHKSWMNQWGSIFVFLLVMQTGMSAQGPFGHPLSESCKKVNHNFEHH